jgi:hypothetical protein
VIHLISDILDRLIDTQSANAHATAQMRDSVTAAAQALEGLKQHFHNGFRSEIKEHISAQLREQDERVEKLLQALVDNAAAAQETSKKSLEIMTELSETMKKPWYWIKIIAGILGSLAIIVAGLIKVISEWG